MAVLQHVGTSFAGSFDTPASTVSVVSGIGPQGQQLVIFDYGFGVSETLDLSGAGAASRLGQGTLPGGAWFDASVGGQSGVLMATGLHNQLDAWAAGNRSGTLMYLDETPQPGLATTTLVADIAGQPMVFAGLQNGAGLTSFTLGSGGLSGAQSYTAATGSYAQTISDFAMVEAGGSHFLYASSASQHGIAGFSVAASGAVQMVEEVGMQQSLPIHTPTALDVAQVGGQSFLIVASAGSSSLTVLSVGADGSLSVTDHIVDGLDTRFQGASQLEVVQVGAQSFVLASGMDDGLSLLHLTAEGRLVHADSLADGQDMALQAISGLAAMADGTGIDIVTISGNEAGLSQFRVDYDASGVVQSSSQGGTLTGTNRADMLSLRGTAPGRLQGGAGADILSDGAGADTLHGGAGPDIFVLREDGQPDVIEDLDITRDRIDLSAWDLLHSMDQLQITPTSWGAVLRYKTEELELHSAGGQGLDVGDLLNVMPDFLSHVTVELGPLQTSPPPPVPYVPPPGPTPLPEPEAAPPDPEPTPSLGVTLVGTDGDDLLEGTPWNDVLSGGAGDDTLVGGEGNDTLAGAAGDDTIRGEAGNDLIGGGPGNDRINGGTGDDTIGAGSGNDYLNGSDGHDLLSGGPGHDTIYGEAGNDMLAGSYGNDRVIGGGGNDNMGGGTGRDLMRGGDGNDTLGGGEGDDTVEGGAGHDFLAAGGRHDRVIGGAGSDTINAGPGDDTMTGGVGADLFVFNALTSGEYDQITDFTPGVDTIRLDDVAGGTQQARFANLEFTATSQGVALHYEGHTILLRDVTLDEIDRTDFLFL